MILILGNVFAGTLNILSISPAESRAEVVQRKPPGEPALVSTGFRVLGFKSYHLFWLCPRVARGLPR